MQLTRRNLFKLGTLTGAAGTLPKWAQARLPAPFHTEVQLSPAQGEEHWVPTTCRQCSAGCGLLARVIAGRAVGIKGDPKHPISQGTLCPKGAASLQELYHPDRIRQPLQRTGNRGEGKWEPISWDAAMEHLAQRLRTVRQSNPSQLGILLGPTPGAIGTLWHRFAGAFGAPHLYEITAAQDELPEDAAATMMGAHDGITVDLSRAEFVLSFCDWLQCFPSPVEASRAYGLLRRGRADRRVRIISAAPRLSVTAAKADEWIPFYPGTEGALALALAHVLIREKLWDEGFVRERTQGFEEFKSLVLQDYAPDQAAHITGVPAETVEHLAKEFADRKPAVALCDRADLLTQMAVLALNALAGNIGKVGGVRLKASLSPASPLTGPNGSPSAAGAPEPEPAGLSFEALLLHHANPLFVQPQRWRTILEQAPFIASISSFLDDTAQYADLILPDHTPLEALVDVPAHTLGSGLVLGISNPVVKPLYDTRQAGDLLLDLARRIGGPVATALPEASYDEAVKQEVKPIYESQRGSPLRKVELEEESWTTESKPTFDLWFKKLAQAGGWADLRAEAKSSSPGFRTPSGKFEFRADVIRTLKPSPLPDRPDYPLRLCIFTPLVFAGGVGAHLPYLQGIAGTRLNERPWETWAEINPITARALGIADGDWVRVESPVGRIRVRAKLFEGAIPDVVSIPFGQGHTAYGRWAAGVGANPAELLETDASTGEPFWRQTHVRVAKAGE
jgi:anaerobic selenocysteine-containing dehydrogenase